MSQKRHQFPATEHGPLAFDAKFKWRMMWLFFGGLESLVVLRRSSVSWASGQPHWTREWQTITRTVFPGTEICNGHRMVSQGPSRNITSQDTVC